MWKWVKAEFMESRFSAKLSLALFFVIEAMVFMLLYDHFSKWYYLALIALIPAILIPVLIEVRERGADIKGYGGIGLF